MGSRRRTFQIIICTSTFGFYIRNGILVRCTVTWPRSDVYINCESIFYRQVQILNLSIIGKAKTFNIMEYKKKRKFNKIVLAALTDCKLSQFVSFNFKDTLTFSKTIFFVCCFFFWCHAISDNYRKSQT